jgi:branched-chain amino acid transport system permease protein
VQVIWGRSSLTFPPPDLLKGPAFTFVQHSQDGLSIVGGRAAEGVCRAAAGISVNCSPFPSTRAFMMVLALLMLLGLWLALTRTRVGLVIQAALTHPEMVEALGHDVPRVFMLVFGAGCALAALAGVAGGITFVTEPSMAALVGSIIFVVVVVGGMGSLAGAFVGALLIGMLQNLPLLSDASLASFATTHLGWAVGPETPGYPLLRITLSQVAPILPYLLLVVMLIVRPKGLFGTRED